MGKRKGQDEFFEVFKRRAARRAISKGEIIEEVKGRPEGEEKLAPAGKPPVSATTREAAYRFSIGSRPQVVFSLSFNACIILVVGFVVFCALIYGIGLWVEKRARPRTLQEIRSTVLEKEPGPLDLQAPGREVKAAVPAVGDYGLRIISYGAGQEEKVKEVVEFLAKEGVPRLNYGQTPDGRFIVVYSGPYPKGDDPSLIELQKKVRGLAFEGREDFKDAKIVKFVHKR